MGMFDYVKYEGPVPKTFSTVPQTKFENFYQCKDFDANMAAFVIGEDRRIRLMTEAELQALGRPGANYWYDETALTYTGVLWLAGSGEATDLVARVTKGVVGEFYHGYWAMEEAEQKRNAEFRRKSGKRYKPKPKVKYVSKKDRERKQGEGMAELGRVMADQLMVAVNRKGFARRILGG